MSKPDVHAARPPATPDGTPPPVDLVAWLPVLHGIEPAQSALVVGAGSGDSGWLAGLQACRVPAVTLVEADDSAFLRLRRRVPAENGWQLLKHVVAAEAGPVRFHRLSVGAESGLHPADVLTPVWPGLTATAVQDRQAVALRDLLRATPARPGWLVIDCLGAAGLLAGAGDALASVRLVIARVLCGAAADAAPGLGEAETERVLAAAGFRRVQAQAGRHPAVVHLLFLRDDAREAARAGAAEAALALDLARTTEQRDTLAAELAQARRELQEQGVRHAAERSARGQEVIAQQAALAQERQVHAQQQQELAQQLEAQQRRAEAQSALREEYATGWAQAKADLRAAEGRIATLEAAWAAARDDVRGRLDALHQAVGAVASQLLQVTERQTDAARLQAEAEGTRAQSLTQSEQRLLKGHQTAIANATRQLEAYMAIQQHFPDGGAGLLDFHGWPISPDIGQFLLQRIQTQGYDLVIEYGSGTSPVLFAKAMPRDDAPAVLTFEHQAPYHAETAARLAAQQLADQVRLVEAPLVDWQDASGDYRYYDDAAELDRLAQTLAGRRCRILLFVDGPPGATCRHARYPAVPHVFSRLAGHDIDVILDDASRPEEKAVVNLWRSYWTGQGVEVQERSVDSEKGIYLAQYRAPN